MVTAQVTWVLPVKESTERLVTCDHNRVCVPWPQLAFDDIMKLAFHQRTQRRAKMLWNMQKPLIAAVFEKNRQRTKSSHWSCAAKPLIRLDEAQARIKISGKNINNLRYADDTTLMAESEEELKSLLMKVKEESEKVGLKLNIQNMKRMASSPITSWQIDGETMETVTDFIFWGSKIFCRWWLKPWK